MPRSLKVYLTGVVTLSAAALLVATLVFPVNPDIGVGLPDFVPEPLRPLVGFGLWTCIVLFASAFPVTMPRGTVVSVSIAPLVAVMVLGGPQAAGWVALIGTTELRELRGRIPWYGTLANHAGLVVATVAGGIAVEA